MGWIEPQGFAFFSGAGLGPHGLCLVRCAARRQASRHENDEWVWGSGSSGGHQGLSGDTFRTVYTLRYAGAVYVLHAFQKKSKTGRETPRGDVELVKQRLREAEQIAKDRES
jgi:hypothetical protein